MALLQGQGTPVGLTPQTVIEPPEKRGVIEYTKPPQNLVPPHQRRPAQPVPKPTR